MILILWYLCLVRCTSWKSIRRLPGLWLPSSNQSLIHSMLSPEASRSFTCKRTSYAVDILSTSLDVTGHHWTAWSWETYERNHLGCWSLWFQRGEFYLVARFRARYIYIYTVICCVYTYYIYIYCVFNMFSWWVMMSHDESMFHALSPAFSDHSTRLAQRLRSQACLDVSGLWLSNTVH